MPAGLRACSGFTSVAQYLEHKTATTGGEAKVSIAAVSIWALIAAAMVVPLGGASAYSDSLAIFTDGGLEMGNLLFLWVAVLSYYSIKVGWGAACAHCIMHNMHNATHSLTAALQCSSKLVPLCPPPRHSRSTTLRLAVRCPCGAIVVVIRNFVTSSLPAASN